MLRYVTCAFALTAILTSCKSVSTSAEESKVAGVEAVFKPSSTCITLDTKPLLKTFKSTGISSTAANALPVDARARDVVALAGQRIPINAKFAYAVSEVELTNRNIDIYLSLNCTEAFKKVGSSTTLFNKTRDTATSLSGQEDGGRIHTTIDALPIGRHKVTLVYSDNNTTADLYVNVLPKDQKILVSDIDGTLTDSEYAAASELVNIAPGMNKGAADVMKYYRDQGFFIFYLTARPDFLTNKTREWLTKNGFPEGAVHTTQSLTGAVGDAAAAYKVAELAELKANTGFVPTVAFGNKPSDVTAFGTSGIAPAGSYYFKLGADAKGGTDFPDYTALLTKLQASASLAH